MAVANIRFPVANVSYLPVENLSNFFFEGILIHSIDWKKVAATAPVERNDKKAYHRAQQLV